MRILESVFSPRSIAVVGASSNPRARVNQNFLQPLLDLGFKGKIYPINPHVTELMGQKAYASVRDVPDTVEQVVCCLPARMTPKVIEDCAAARVKVVIFYSAGLAETGEEVGVELQREVVEIARRGGVRIIGPNCLGVHCPGAGITFESNGRRQSGHVSFLSQSGGNAREIILLGAQRGVLFSKGISYGNAADLNETDFLECFASDADTAIIDAYIEGIKEPRRFLDALTRATAAKPVVVLKGGKTHGGTRAVNSHTGALAGSTETWNALCQQRNVIQVGSLSEMTDVTLAFSYVRAPRGRRVGLVGIGGGACVQATDDCESVGLRVPAFPAELQGLLKEFTPLTGVGLANPVDTAADVYWDPSAFSKTVRLVADFDGVDMLIVSLPVAYAINSDPGTVGQQLDAVCRVGKSSGKPLLIVLYTGGMLHAEQVASQVQGQCLEAGFPVYRSVRQAAQAMAHLISYCHRATSPED